MAMQKILMRTTLQRARPPIQTHNSQTSLVAPVVGDLPFEDMLVDNLPVDIRTLRKRFGVGAKLDIYAVCPKKTCSKVYKPTINAAGIRIFPRTCHDNRGGSAMPCGTLLCKDAVGENGETVRVPLLPYPVQDWNDFKARLVADPLTYSLLRRGMESQAMDIKTDISHGSHLSSLKDIHGKKFMSKESGELRLAWTFSADWYNQYHNKISGKKGSDGSVLMTCLNLPPCLRYRTEYAYLAAIIPGDPKDDRINYFLDIIVDKLSHSYEHGTFYKSVGANNGGVLERSILALNIHDLPGARKCGGLHSYSSVKHFCYLCHQNKNDINDLNFRDWRMRDKETHRVVATRWLESTADERDELYKSNGIRWTPFLRLKYWDPYSFIIIDGMHNLFLGVTANFVRVVLGIDEVAEKKKTKATKTVDAAALAAAREGLQNRPTMNSLMKHSKPVLMALCTERDCRPAAKKASKEMLASAILVIDYYFLA